METHKPTTYAIIGSGNIGTTLARLFARAGVPCVIANRRGPDSLKSLAAELGEKIVPGTLDDALAADVLLLAVPYAAVDSLARVRSDWRGKIVIDATNAMGVSKDALGGRLSSDIVAEAFSGARVVKAFNYLPARVLGRDPTGDGGRRVMFIAGNDDRANSLVEALSSDLGFAPSMLGRIDGGGRLLHEIPGPLMLHNLVEFAL